MQDKGFPDGQLQNLFLKQYRIDFSRSNLYLQGRQVIIWDHRGGFLSQISSFLTWIRTYIRETQLVKVYGLQYDLTSNRPILKEVTLRDKNGISFPGKITINYTSHGKGFDASFIPWVTPYQVKYFYNYQYGAEDPIYYCDEEYLTPEVQSFEGGNNIDVLQIDMNGDGLPDRVEKPKDTTNGQCSPYTNQYLVYLNTGGGFASQSSPWTIPGIYWEHPVYFSGYGNSTGLVAMFKDMNGDGRPDRVEFDYYNPYKHLNVYLNDGSGFYGQPNGEPFRWKVGFTGGHAVFPQNQTNSGAYNTYVIADLIDMNGDGLPDRVTRSPYSNPGSLRVYRGKGERPYLLKSITNGLGGTTTVTYTPSTQFDHSGGDGIPDLPFVLPLVTSLTVEDGRGASYTTSYEYQDGYFFTGVSSISGAYEREFRGFKEVWAKNAATETTTYTLFDQGLTEEQFKGTVLLQRVNTTGRQFREVQNYWVIEDSYYDTGYPFPSPFPALRSVYSTFCDRSELHFDDLCWSNSYEYRTRVESWFNENGDVILIKNYGDLAKTDDDFSQKITYQTFAPEKHILNRPHIIETKDGLGNSAAKKTMEYDLLGNLSSERAWNNMPDEQQYSPGDPIVNYAYDGPYNNLKSVSDPRNSTYLTTFTYTPYGATDMADLFPTAVKNAKGHEAKKSYDPATGNVLSIIDPNGYTTSFEYDSFGRPIGEERPDGGYTRIDYSLYGEGGNDYSSIRASEYARKADFTGGGNPLVESIAYYDGLGRVFKSRKSAPPNGGNLPWVYSCTFFDTAGRVEYSSNPIFGNEAFACPTPPEEGDYTRYYYDGLDRITQTDIPDDAGTLSVKTYYFGLRKAIIDPRGNSTDYYSDTSGRLVKVTNYTWENGYFTTTYTYDILDNLTEVRREAKSETGSYLRDIVTTMTYDSLGRKRSMLDPDMGLWEYKYDLAGNLMWQKDARGAVTTFSYDQLNRITSKYTAEENITYFYDYGWAGSNTTGRLAAVWSQDWVNGSYYEYGYDSMGRLVEEDFWPWWENDYYIKRYEYNTLGQVTAVTFPDNTRYTYDYNNTSYLRQVVDPGGKVLAEYSNFTPFLQPGRIKYGHGVTTDRAFYPKSGKLMWMWTEGGRIPAGQALDFSYQYDQNGNVTTITDWVSGKIRSFTYDRLNRLTSADAPGVYSREDYKYDSLGNLKQKGLNTYNYDYTLRPHAPYSVDTPGGSKNYGYDPNGNMTNRDGKTIVFNSQNMPTNVQGANGSFSLVYDPLGARVKKVSGTKTIIYFGASYEIEREGTSQTIRKHIFAGGDRIVTIEGSSRYFYYHGDHLGSTSLVTIDNTGHPENSGDWFQKAGYYPFGEKITDLTYQNPAYISDPFSARYLFTGQEEDGEAGLYNYNARLYDPFLGKFISPDPIVPSPGNPQSLNRYSYVLNNPLKFIDPSGHGFFSKLWKAITHAFIPAIFAAAIFAFAHPIGIALLGAGKGALIFAGVAAGMAGGAAAAGMYGGDVLQGALLGGVLGGIGAWLGPPLAGALGSGLRGAVGSAMTIAAGASAVGTALYGGNLLENMAIGAITAGVYAAAFYGAYKAYKWAQAYDNRANNVPEHVGQIK